MIWIILSAVVAVLFWYVFVKPLRYWSDRGVKQSKPWLFLGDTWITLFRRKSFSEFVEWIYNMYPNSRYSGFYQFYTPTLVIRDPELIKQITVKDFDHFTDHRSFVDPEADPLWGRNLFSLKGQRWREMRATLSGSFTSSKMKTMFNLMDEAADNFVKYFLDKNEDLIELEMKDTYTRYTNDVIATTAFGIKVDSLAQPKNTFYMMGKKMTNFSGIITNLKFFGYFLIPSIYKRLKISILDRTASQFFKSIINETIQTRVEKAIVRPDMINMLLEARKGIKQEENDTLDTGFATVQESTDISKFKQLKTLTNDDITSQALIFFFAGFDTISTAMCFGSYELAINKDIQDKLRDEIRKTYKENNGKITYEVLLKMKYMDMVVSEILRKWPPAIGTDRDCNKPYTIPAKSPEERPVHIDEKVMISIPIIGLHRDPQYYPDPEKFDPERFDKEKKQNIIDFTYMPFGCGPRKCIASRFALVELKTLLFKFLLHFEILPGKKLKLPLRLDKTSFNLMMIGGFWFILKKNEYLNFFSTTSGKILRKWPPFPAIDRVCTKTYIIPSQYPDERSLQLEPGSLINIPYVGIQRNSLYYPNPEIFDPERFSDENKANIKPFTYMPFGTGPRICIASRFAIVELKSLFYKLLLNYELLPSTKMKMPVQLIKGIFNPLAEGGFWFNLKKNLL